MVKVGQLICLVICALHGEVRSDSGLENISLSADGSMTSDCQLAQDQCAFRDTRSGITFSSLSPGLKADPPDRQVDLPFEKAKANCEELDWAGLTDWRLPSFREANYLQSTIATQVKQYPGLGDINAFLWLEGFQNRYQQGAVVYSPHRSWVGNLFTQRWLPLPKTSLAAHRCIQSDADQLWEDISVNSDTGESDSCTSPTVDCVFRHRRSGLIFTPPKTYLFRREQPGVTLDEAQRYCSSLNYLKKGGRSGWRIPNYEEARAGAQSFFWSFALSRDGIQEVPDGDFWVSEPDNDDQPAQCGRNETLLFSGYVCNLRSTKCDRRTQCLSVFRNRYEGMPPLPAAKLICVTNGRLNVEPALPTFQRGRRR